MLYFYCVEFSIPPSNFFGEQRVIKKVSGVIEISEGINDQSELVKEIMKSIKHQVYEKIKKSKTNGEISADNYEIVALNRL